VEPPDLHIANKIVSRLIRIGLPIGPMAVLTVPGRRSGEPRSAPIALTPAGGGWRLIAAYGVVDWVKNLRHAGSATITVRGRTFPVTARELAPEEAAPLLRESLVTAGPMTRRMVGPYFTAAVNDPFEAWLAESRRHPVFILTETG